MKTDHYNQIRLGAAKRPKDIPLDKLFKGNIVSKGKLTYDSK
jgi:hypothetical protein